METRREDSDALVTDRPIAPELLGLPEREMAEESGGRCDGKNKFTGTLNTGILSPFHRQLHMQTQRGVMNAYVTIGPGSVVILPLKQVAS